MSLVKLISIALCAGIGGCAIKLYTLDAGVPSAQFSMEAGTDSAHTTSRGAQALAHEDLVCARSKHVLELAHGRIGHRTPAVRIAVGAPFVFSAVYGETGFASEKSCLITASFTPVADHRYLAVLATRDQVAQCGLGIFDITAGDEQRVEFHMPEKNCIGEPNGRPTWIHHRILVISR